MTANSRSRFGGWGRGRGGEGPGNQLHCPSHLGEDPSSTTCSPKFSHWTWSVSSLKGKALFEKCPVYEGIVQIAFGIALSDNTCTAKCQRGGGEILQITRFFMDFTHSLPKKKVLKPVKIPPKDNKSGHTCVSAFIYCLMKWGTITAQYTLNFCHYDFVSAELVQ